jgi:hypothetical protein
VEQPLNPTKQSWGHMDLMAFNRFDVCRTHGPGTGGLGGGRLRERLMMTDICVRTGEEERLSPVDGPA